MASLVLASAYFATVWIGRSVRREVLAGTAEPAAAPLLPGFAELLDMDDG